MTVERATNPVIRGCFPDPSVCRVGGDYYLVASSFGFFPGLPLFHSRDLVNWELIGHAVGREEDLPVRGLAFSDGIWAATIRYNAGTFYVIYSFAVDRQGQGFFLVTATDPAGPWSTPVHLQADGIDPDLFFDSDGRCWITATRNSTDPAATGPGEIWTREFDVEAETWRGPTHALWNGALAGSWVEAPHLYLRDGTYHLIAAEGGTERGHAITAARSSTLTGRYRTDTRSPLLTHRHLSRRVEIQNVGHADLVEDPDGRWWAVLLAVRTIDGTHTLGREVFLAPVEWEDDRPVFAPRTGRLERDIDTPILRVAPDQSRIGKDFAAGRLDSHWVGLRGDARQYVRPADDTGIVLRSNGVGLDDLGCPAYLGRRLDAIDFTATVQLRMEEGGDARGGLAIFYDENNFASISLAHDGNLRFEVVLDGALSEAVTDAARGETVLSITGDRDGFRFAATTGDTRIELGRVDRFALTTERIGGFVGLQVGIFSSGHEGSSVHFTSFELRSGGQTTISA